MFNLICAGFIALLGIITGVIGLLVPVNALQIIGLIFVCVSIIWLFASFINSLVYYTEQNNRFENIRAKLKNLKIWKERQDDLITEFKYYLADKYPDIEKEIFRMITESKSDVHVILNYPELKSSKTIANLVKQINNLSGKVYNARIELEYECAEIRFYKNNKWFLVTPEVPEDILKLL